MYYSKHSITISSFIPFIVPFLHFQRKNAIAWLMVSIFIIDYSMNKNIYLFSPFSKGILLFSVKSFFYFRLISVENDRKKRTSTLIIPTNAFQSHILTRCSPDRVAMVTSNFDKILTRTHIKQRIYCVE